MEDNIILFSASSDKVGVAIHILNLAKMLSENSSLLTVICPKKGWLSEALKKENIQFDILDISYHPKKYITSSLIVYRFLKHFNKPLILHIHGRFPLFLSVLSFYLLKETKYIYTIHEFENASNSGLLQWKRIFESYLFHHIEKIIGVSEALTNEIKKKLADNKKNRCVAIYNFIDFIPYQASDKTVHDDKLIKICSIGRLTFIKGFDQVIEVIKMLDTKGYKIVYDIYGSGEEYQKLDKQIKFFALEKSIFLKGSIDNTILRNNLQKYDMVVIPSRSESFGIVALESFNAKVPVIASNIQGLNEIVVDNKTGLCFEVNNYQQLMSKILKIIHNDEEIRPITENAYHKFLEITDHNKIKEKYRKIYE